MKKWWLGYIVLIITIGALVYWNIYKDKKIMALESHIAQEKEKNKNYSLHDDCINSMAKTLMVAYNLSKWEAHYYAIIFDDFSKFFNTPWEIYPAVVRIESNFKCNVGSPKGAKGMMQLLEATGKGVADEYGIEYIPNQTLWNTTINLILGCGYLSKNIKEKGLEGGVKSYLGGPDYLKAVKSNKIASQYIGEYKSTVWKEYRELTCIFKGIVNSSIYNEIHPFQDSIPLNPEIFVFTKAVKDTPVKRMDSTVKEKRVIRTKPVEVKIDDPLDTTEHPNQ